MLSLGLDECEPDFSASMQDYSSKSLLLNSLQPMPLVVASAVLLFKSEMILTLRAESGRSMLRSVAPSSMICSREKYEHSAKAVCGCVRRVLRD